MICLPKNIVHALQCAAKEEGRYSMSGVHVREYAADHYRVEITDGKRLAVVQGPSHSSPAPQPPQEGEAVHYLVPLAELKKAFADAPKDQGVLICCSQENVRIVSGGAERTVLTKEGRFPDVDLVMPKGPPLVAVNVNPEYLISLLKAAGAVSAGLDGKENQRVTLLIWKHDTPIAVIASHNESGQSFDGLLMPLS